jgi:hypothetical protein
VNILSYFKNPSLVFRFGSPRKRQQYHKLRNFLTSGVLAKRREFTTSLPKPRQIIDSGKGFHKTNIFNSLEALNDSINHGNELIASHLGNFGGLPHKKNYLQNIEYELSLDNPFLQLGLNKDLVSIASEYLGFVPILSNINLWYSPNDGSSTEGSQLFHLDWADIRQCKLFIPLKEIDDDTGPTTFLPAAESSKVANAVNYRLSNESNRLEDEVVYSITDKSQVEKAGGEPGDIIFCDSCRCFHYGSRNALKPRSLLMIQYLSPFSFVHPFFFRGKSKFSHLASPDSSEFEKMVLGAT